MRNTNASVLLYSIIFISHGNKMSQNYLSWQLQNVSQGLHFNWKLRHQLLLDRRRSRSRVMLSRVQVTISQNSR